MPHNHHLPSKPSMDYAQLLEVLNQASTFDLFRLSTLIDREIESPERIARIKASLVVGQRISYLDTRSNALRPCEVVRLNPKRAVIKDLGKGKRYAIPYFMLNIEGADARVNHEVDKGLSRHSISAGDWLGFKDKQGIERLARVIRLNDKSVTMVEKDSKRQWRVAYSLLYRVLDGDSEQSLEPLIEERFTGESQTSLLD